MEVRGQGTFTGKERSCMGKWSAEAISWKISRLANEADVENQITYQGSIIQLVGSSRTLPNMKHLRKRRAVLCSRCYMFKEYSEYRPFIYVLYSS